MNYKAIEEAVGHRIKALSKTHGWAPTQVAQRLVAEQIIDLKTWTAGFGPLYSMLKGGLTVAQAFRPTADADMQVARHYSEDELLCAMREIAPFVRQHGVLIEDARVRQIDVGYGDPIQRIEVKAFAGGIRANTNIDISTGFGRDAWPDPKDVFLEEFPSFSPKFPTYTARKQPIESALAEKWIACVFQDPRDPSVKHKYDLALMHGQDGVDIAKVAREILRNCRHRGIRWVDFTSAARRLFDSLEFQRLPAWEKENLARGTSIDFIDGFLFLGDTWHNKLSANVTHEFSKIKTAEFIAKAAANNRLRASVAAENNVIPFRPRGVA